MIKLQCNILILCIAVFSTSAIAEDYIHDGQPCLNGICVGDEISTLSKIKWEPAAYRGAPITSLKLNTKDVEQSVIKHFAPDSAPSAREAALYLRTDSFDGKAIPKLARIKGFCERIVVHGFEQNLDGMGMVGTFISESGHKTSVLINVVPGADPTTQSLRVVEIRRSYPKEYTSEQINELSKQFEERYSGIKKTRYNPNPTEATWNFDSQYRVLILFAPSGNIEQISTQLRQYPGCTKTLKID